MAGIDAGAALSGMLQTENVGMEKMIYNIVANPNIRYIVLCGRESALAPGRPSPPSSGLWWKCRCSSAW
jgi:Tetrahydromethanopterin S-methyltransferase, subunit A